MEPTPSGLFIGKCSFLLKEFHFLALDFRKQQVGKTTGSQAEQFVVQPFFAEHFLDDGVINQCIVHAVDSSCGLKAYLDTRQLVIFLDGLAHNQGGLRRGGRLLLAGGSLMKSAPEYMERMDAF